MAGKSALIWKGVSVCTELVDLGFVERHRRAGLGNEAYANGVGSGVVAQLDRQAAWRRFGGRYARLEVVDSLLLQVGRTAVVKVATGPVTKPHSPYRVNLPRSVAAIA